VVLVVELSSLHLVEQVVELSSLHLVVLVVVLFPR
jgi:hypothetical protein